MLDVVAHNNLRMRGQAFVSFPSAEIAKKAMKDVQRFPLYSKPMVRGFIVYLDRRNADNLFFFKQISFARTRSDAVVKRLDSNQFDDHKSKREERKSASCLHQNRCRMLTIYLYFTRVNTIHKSVEIKVQSEETGCRKSVVYNLCLIDATTELSLHF